MDNIEIATRIRDALWELEGGHLDVADGKLNALVAELETANNATLNGPRPVRPGDIPEDGRIEILNSGGEFAAYFKLDALTEGYDGDGGGGTIEEACREAVDKAR